MVVGAIGAGKDLAAETDAEHRLAGIAEAAGEPGELRQVGVRLVIQRALFAAENDERVMGGYVWRQDTVPPDAEPFDIRSRLVERRGKRAEAGIAHIFDDCDSHRFFPMADDRKRPCRRTARKMLAQARLRRRAMRPFGRTKDALTL